MGKQNVQAKEVYSSIDRSVAEQPGIFSKPWVLGAKAAQRVLEVT